MLNRILIAGFDKSANTDIGRQMTKDFSNSLVLVENEFQKAIDTGDKYRWLSSLIDFEDYYHQDIIVLWVGTNSKKKLLENPNNKRLLDYSNELLFCPYSNKKLHNIRTRIYFTNISEKVRLSDVANTIKNTLGSGNIPTFEAKDNILWTYDFPMLELVNN